MTEEGVALSTTSIKHFWRPIQESFWPVSLFEMVLFQIRFLVMVIALTN